MIPEGAKVKTGFKEVLKNIGKGNVSKLFIAEDCSYSMKEKLEDAAKTSGIEIAYKQTMKELGAICGIDVGASCAAVLKN